MNAIEMKQFTTPLSLSNSEYLKLVTDAIERSNAMPREPRAEIREGAQANWHLVVTSAATDAYEDLADHGIGVYRPMYQRNVISHGRSHPRSYPLLPGYLLIFVWDIDRHTNLILGCKGVTRIVRYSGDDGRYAVIPPAVISRFMMLETNDEDVRASVADIPGLQFQKAKPKRKRDRRANRYCAPPAAMGEDEPFLVTISCWSALDRLADLAPEDRISAFNKAMGLPSREFSGSPAKSSDQRVEETAAAYTDSA